MGDGILQELSSLAPPRRWWYLEVHFENKARLKPDKATSTAQLRFPLYRLAGCFDGLLAPHHFQPYPSLEDERSLAIASSIKLLGFGADGEVVGCSPPWANSLEQYLRHHALVFMIQQMTVEERHAANDWIGEIHHQVH
jgi:hypothetical protein